MKIVFLSLLFSIVASAEMFSIPKETMDQNPDLKVRCSPGVKCINGVAKAGRHAKSIIQINNRTVVVESDDNVTWTGSGDVSWTVNPFASCGFDPKTEMIQTTKETNGVTTYKLSSGRSFTLDLEGNVTCKKP